jgi:hypothetical protein
MFLSQRIENEVRQGVHFGDYVAMQGLLSHQPFAPEQ